MTSSILKVQLATLAQNLMSQNRPRKDKIFSGNDNSIDFESYLMDFDKVTNVEGATPEMISLELRHWFVGPAGIIVQKYSNEKDPKVSIDKTKRHLRREYGRRNYSARQMLDELLTGPPLNAKDHVVVQTFVSKLENVHQRALETKRESSFDTSETYDSILNKKLPSFINRWAAAVEKHIERYAGDAGDEDIPELTFSNFISYLKLQNRIGRRRKVIIESATASGKPTGGNPRATPSTRPGGGHRGKATYAQVAALDAVAEADESEGLSDGSDSESLTDSSETVDAAVCAAATVPPRSVPRKTTPVALAKSTSSKGMAPARRKGEDSSARPWSCWVCKSQSKHRLEECQQFQQSDEKMKLCFTRGICYVCLNRGHLSSQCESQSSCSKCGQRHHDLLHDEKKPEVKTSEKDKTE